jgi:hypothetical protein
LTLLLAHLDNAIAAAHEVTFELDASWEPRDIDTEMEQIRKTYPKQPISHLVGLHPLSPSREQICTFRKELCSGHELDQAEKQALEFPR